MTIKDADNIPLLDNLVTKKSPHKKVPRQSQVALEQKIHDILQRHTTQATAEILTAINKNSQN